MRPSGAVFEKHTLISGEKARTSIIREKLDCILGLESVPADRSR